MTRNLSGRRPVVALAAAAALLLSAASVVGSLDSGAAVAHPATHTTPAAPVASSKDCPAGQVREQDTSLADYVTKGLVGSCAPALHAEGTELMTANAQLQARTTAGEPALKAGALASAVAQKAQIAAASTAPESTAPWTPLGVGSEHADVAGYGQVNGLGLASLSGRIQSFDHDPSNPAHWWAGVSAGGVFETTNSGASWHSIGDTLPTQLVGAIAYIPATSTTKARLLANTGDPSFGGDAISGLGAYWTEDDGVTWHKATAVAGKQGIPDGTTAFRIAYDPASPNVVYAATGKGLYRSDDAGTSYQNVNLPTTCTSTTDPICFFANIVTDVVVRTPSAGQTGPSAVLAAVGWRAGQKLNTQGKPQAPQNGLYSSASGAVGSFTYASPTGFPTTAQVGRVALGAATGPTQNHGYVYAVVEDATKFNGSTTGELDIPNPNGTVPNATYLKGVYVSSDFGATWAQLTGPTQFGATSGTALLGPGATSYAPGVQSWYNEWVAVDPTQATAAGSPMRVDLGLEEIYENQLPLGDTQTTTLDSTPFKVIGAYFKGGSCGGLNTNLPVCPTGYNSLASSTTTHPDQHAAMFIPDNSGGVTLVVGNDGGVYAQHVASGYSVANVAGNGISTADFDNAKWGNGVNEGLHTLQPYIAKMAKDGTVYGGLQDNGNLKITPAGQEIETYGGDGFYAGVDPDNSNTTYEEYTNGAIAGSTDGGQTYRAMPPPNASATTALFAAPFVLDPLNANHILAGNTGIAETAVGPTTDDGSNDPTGTGADTTEDWVDVFDLGTSPTAAGGTTNNIPSATDLRGDAAYVGFCGFCDIITGGLPFHSGLATNVGGSAAPAFGTAAGWHIAAANGLPQRYISSVKIDPADPKTVYVTMGGYGRRWIPPGSLGDDTSKVGTGHVFVSHDAGNNFTDITGNLPDVPADDTVLQNGRLLVATDIGTFFAPTAAGGTYQQLGANLPAAPVFSLEVSPRNTNEIVAATYGRGVYDLLLPASAGTAGVTTTSATTTTATTTTVPKKATTTKTTKTAKKSTKAKKVVKPVQPKRTLAFTGLSPALAGLAVLCLLAAAILARRSRRGHGTHS